MGLRGEIMKKGMTEEEFKDWKKDWYKRVPGCENFVCCHELMSCGIKIFCGDCSIYDTYTRDSNPRECDIVGCDDCFIKYECKDYERIRAIRYESGDSGEEKVEK